MMIFGNILVNLLLLPIYFKFWCLSYLLAWIPIFPTRVAVKNLRERLNKNRIQAAWIISWVYMNYVFSFFEMLIFWPLGLDFMKNESALVDFLKRYHVSSGAQENKVGFIFLGGHLSNFDFLGTVVSRAANQAVSNQFYAFAKPAKHKWITQLLNWYRHQRHMNLLWTHNSGLIKETLRAIKNGDNISFLIDQKPESGGVFIKFFGAYAAFPYAGLDMGLRAKMPIVHVAHSRIIPGVHELFFEEGGNFHRAPNSDKPLGQIQARVYAHFHSEKEKQAAPILACFVDWFEARVRDHIHQWCWDYKKWSRQPKQ